MGTLMALVDNLHKKSVQGLQSYNNVNDMNNNIQMDNTFRAPKSAAMFDLTITRNTANIPANLPIPFFGALDYQSNYVEVISSYLPSGVSLKWGDTGKNPIQLSPSGKGLRFYFTDAEDAIDTIDVECAQVPYVNLLRATQGSLINLQQNKMTISDVSVQSQFSNSVYIYRNSIFGKDSTDSFTPNQFKSDLQNQNDIRTITTNYTVDQETSLLFLVKNVPSFQIGWTSYVEQYDTIRA